MTALLAQMAANQKSGASPSKNEQLPLPKIDLFVAEPDDPQKFDRWLPRFELAVECASPNLDSKAKVKFLLTKLSTYVFDEYSKSILPKVVKDLDYDETITALRKMLASKRSIFLDRFETLRFNKEEGEEFTSFTRACYRFKSSFHKFKFNELNEEQFKGLLFLSAMRSPDDEALRTRILNKLHNDGANIKFNEIIDECKRYLSTKSDAKSFENKSFQIHALHKKAKSFYKNTAPIKNRFSEKQPQSSSNKRKPSSPCSRCGAMHWFKDCPHANATCPKCKKRGHLEKVCKQGRNQKVNNLIVSTLQVNALTKRPSTLVTITALVNNVPVSFIIDSGSEATLINEETYHKFGRPKITSCCEKSRAYDGSIIPFLGTFSMDVKFNDQTAMLKIYLAKKGALNLLGTDFMDTFGFLATFRAIFSPTPDQSQYLLKPAKSFKSLNSRVDTQNIQNIRLNIKDVSAIKAKTNIKEVPLNPENISQKFSKNNKKQILDLPPRANQYSTTTGQPSSHMDQSKIMGELEAKFPEVFAPGLGHCKKTQARLCLKPEATPRIHRSDAT